MRGRELVRDNACKETDLANKQNRKTHNDQNDLQIVCKRCAKGVKKLGNVCIVYTAYKRYRSNTELDFHSELGE